MAITLDSLKPKTSIAVTREYEYDDVKIIIEYDGSESFKRAYSRLNEIDAEEKKEDETKLLSKEYNSGNRMTSMERQLFVMGEHLISDWEGVNTSDGKKAEINGQNFMKLCGAISKDTDKQVEFMTKIFELISEVVNEFKDKTEKLKKKPVKSTATAKKQAS